MVKKGTTPRQSAIVSKKTEKTTNDNHVFVFRSPTKTMIISPPRTQDRVAGKTRKKQLKQRKSANEGVLSPKEELDRLLGGDSEKIREEMMRDLQETNFKESSSSAISFVPMSWIVGRLIDFDFVI